MRGLTEREWRTLSDVSNPAECLLSDGETLERLVREGLVSFQESCYRPTALGTEALRNFQAAQDDSQNL